MVYRRHQLPVIRKARIGSNSSLLSVSFALGLYGAVRFSAGPVDVSEPFGCSPLRSRVTSSNPLNSKKCAEADGDVLHKRHRSLSLRQVLLQSVQVTLMLLIPSSSPSKNQSHRYQGKKGVDSTYSRVESLKIQLALTPGQ